MVGGSLYWQWRTSLLRTIEAFLVGESVGVPLLGESMTLPQHSLAAVAGSLCQVGHQNIQSSGHRQAQLVLQVCH